WTAITPPMVATAPNPATRQKRTKTPRLLFSEGCGILLSTRPTGASGAKRARTRRNRGTLAALASAFASAFAALASALAALVSALAAFASALAAFASVGSVGSSGLVG